VHSEINQSTSEVGPFKGPGLRRVLDALSVLASGLEQDKREIEIPLEEDWRSSFAAGQRNVIQHYRAVLARQRMAPAERQALLDRIAKIDAEIQSVELDVRKAWLTAA
jgi:hypothetical protein